MSIAPRHSEQLCFIQLPEEILLMVILYTEDDVLTRASLAFTHPSLRLVIGSDPWNILKRTYRGELPNRSRRIQWLEMLRRDLPSYYLCESCAILHPNPPVARSVSQRDLEIGPSGRFSGASLRVEWCDVINAITYHRRGRASACATRFLTKETSTLLNDTWFTTSASAHFVGRELFWNGSFEFHVSSREFRVNHALETYGFRACEHCSWTTGIQRTLDEMGRSIWNWMNPPRYPPFQITYTDFQDFFQPGHDRYSTTMWCKVCDTTIGVRARGMSQIYSTYEGSYIRI